jgi:kinesin family protein 6/9
VSYLEIYND